VGCAAIELPKARGVKLILAIRRIGGGYPGGCQFLFAQASPGGVPSI
jgi:hypothetical protein